MGDRVGYFYDLDRTSPHIDEASMMLRDAEGEGDRKLDFLKGKGRSIDCKGLAINNVLPFLAIRPHVRKGILLR